MDGGRTAGWRECSSVISQMEPIPVAIALPTGVFPEPDLFAAYTQHQQQAQRANPTGKKVDKKEPKLCRATDERVLAVAQAALHHEYMKAIHVHGMKGTCQRKVHAQCLLDKDLFTPEPSTETIFSWLDARLAKRKAEVGKKANNDHTGGGDEDEEDAILAGREHVDYNSPLSQALDDLILVETEYLQEKEKGKEHAAAREKMGEEMMREAMSGKKSKKPVRRACTQFSNCHTSCSRSLAPSCAGDGLPGGHGQEGARQGEGDRGGRGRARAGQ